MLGFFLYRLFILTGVIATTYNLAVYDNVSLVVIDLSPVGYMVYCHRRMFRRETIQYNFEYKDNLPRRSGHLSGGVLD